MANAIANFVVSIKDKKNAIKNLKISIDTLKTKDLLDKNELLPYQDYLHCLEIVYNQRFI